MAPETAAGDTAAHQNAWTYDVVGFLSAQIGLSVAARNSIEALSVSGRMVRAVAVGPRNPRLLARLPKRVAHHSSGPHVSLFHVNPLEIAALAPQWSGLVAPKASRVTVPFWELPLVPRSWVPLLSAMDAVLAPTKFIEDACAKAIGPSRVLHYPQAVAVPRDTAPAREEWDLDRDALVCVVSFDIGSDIERKNPWGAIEAFRRAFPTEQDVQLVIKMKPWPDVPEYRADAEKLRAEIASDRRMRVIDAVLSYRDLLRLYASCDVMLSLHRSEGLGLHLMEAMSLGKVVVATGWSGNMDFMSEANSVPIGYTLVPVSPRHPAYRAEIGRSGQVWAEPDVTGAAEALRSLRADRARRETLGAAASLEMESRRVQARSGDAFDRLEGMLRTARARPKALGPAVMWARIKMLSAGHAARACGLVAGAFRPVRSTRERSRVTTTKP